MFAIKTNPRHKGTRQFYTILIIRNLTIDRHCLWKAKISKEIGLLGILIKWGRDEYYLMLTLDFFSHEVEPSATDGGNLHTQ